MSSALPPPCLHRSHCVLNEVLRYPLSYPQQTRSLRSTLAALHRQVAQVLPRLLALTSPLAPRSQQLSPSHRSHTPFVDPSHLRPPLTRRSCRWSCRWPAQGHKAAAGVLGGRWRGERRWSREMGGVGWRSRRSPPNHHLAFTTTSTPPDTTPLSLVWPAPGFEPREMEYTPIPSPLRLHPKGCGRRGLILR